MKHYQVIDDTATNVEEILNTISKEHTFQIEGFQATYGKTMTYFHMVIAYEVDTPVKEDEYSHDDYPHSKPHMKAIEEALKPKKKKKMPPLKKTGTG